LTAADLLAVCHARGVTVEPDPSGTRLALRPAERARALDVRWREALRDMKAEVLAELRRREAMSAAIRLAESRTPPAVACPFCGAPVLLGWTRCHTPLLVEPRAFIWAPGGDHQVLLATGVLYHTAHVAKHNAIATLGAGHELHLCTTAAAQGVA
jgi:hypothetical protein